MLKDKINERLDSLEKIMDTQSHITDPISALECIDSISKFWSILEEDQKEYVQCARSAVENKTEWK